MTGKIRYCYLEPDFPKRIYIACVFLKIDKGTLLYPMFETFVDMKKLRTALRKLKKGIEKKDEDTNAYGGLVVTIEYDHNFHLKKEYWEPSENPNLNKDIRMTAFLEMLKGPTSFYWTLITPQSYDVKTKSWRLTSWLPIRITSTDEQIEALIKSSDQSVSEKAKYIGIYSVAKVQGFDIDEGKLVDPKDTSPVGEANC